MTRVRDANTTDIASAIRMGSACICSVGNADDHGRPFFGSRVRPEAWLRFSSSFGEAHVPGRHLNALLNAEAATGQPLDPACVERLTEAAFYAFDGPVALPMGRLEPGALHTEFQPHNLREGLHALYALVRFRGSERALGTARACIEAVLRFWTPARGWDEAALAQHGVHLHRGTRIFGIARCIGPLVKLYAATGYGPALELALSIKDLVLAHDFPADGRYDREVMGTHTHSTTCVMSSLAQLAHLCRDADLMERVRTFYDRGLPDIRDQLGWVIESSSDTANPDRGECNNTGDLIETALILATWGYPQYAEDAELMLRGHLLPSQLRDVSFIQEPANPEQVDGLCAIRQRHLGAFGFPAPYGHEPLGVDHISFNMDIVGGAVSSLCEAWRNIVTTHDGHTRLNLWFDVQDERLSVESPYTHSAMRLRPGVPGQVWIRVPQWLDRRRVVMHGLTGGHLWTDHYLVLPQPTAGQWITLQLDLAERVLTLPHRTRTIGVHLRGDQVIAMQSHGADLTFFAELG